MSGVFARQRILVVEDEVMIAEYLADALEQEGAQVVIAVRLQDALKRVDERITAGIVDPRLRDVETAEVCHKLRARGIPFIVFTGYPHVGPAYAAGVVITKPASADRLIAELARLLGLS